MQKRSTSGIVYGISSFGLSQDLSITRKEAEGYIASYFDTYPAINKFLDRLVTDAKEKGYGNDVWQTQTGSGAVLQQLHAAFLR